MKLRKITLIAILVAMIALVIGMTMAIATGKPQITPPTVKITFAPKPTFYIRTITGPLPGAIGGGADGMNCCDTALRDQALGLTEICKGEYFPAVQLTGAISATVRQQFLDSLTAACKRHYTEIIVDDVVVWPLS